MVSPRLVFWALPLLGLGLLGSSGQAGRGGGCSVPDVLRHYRAVIFEDLQAALRRPGGTRPGSRQRHLHQRNVTRAGACSAQKERGILLSIAALGRSLQEAVAGGRGALEKAARTVAARTEAALRHHCRTLRQSPRPGTRPTRHPGRRRRLLLRSLDAVATCWEKLFALHGRAAES